MRNSQMGAGGRFDIFLDSDEDIPENERKCSGVMNSSCTSINLIPTPLQVANIYVGTEEVFSGFETSYVKIRLGYVMRPPEPFSNGCVEAPWTLRP